MTSNINILSNLRSVKKSFITLKGEFEALYSGDVQTDEVVLFNVLYCPDIRYDRDIIVFSYDS